MTAGRRALRYHSLDEIMPDVERLLEGHRTVGRWTLAQICRHLSMAMRRAVDLSASTAHDPSNRVSEEEKRQIFETGVLPEGLSGATEILPTVTLGAGEEAEGLRAAIAHYRGSPPRSLPHGYFGPLSRDEWDRLQLIHFAHHLSFAVPTTG